MNEVTLRKYRPEDQEAVYALHILALKQTGAYIENPEMREEWDQDLLTIPDTYLAHGEFLVAEIDGTIVGMGAFRKHDERTAEIKRMRVDPAYQGRGIGSLLLEALTAEAKKQGYTRLVLDTSTLQTVSQRLYESRGFTLYKRAQEWGLDMLYYEKDI